jgi:hypothetical protein
MVYTEQGKYQDRKNDKNPQYPGMPQGVCGHFSVFPFFEPFFLPEKEKIVLVFYLLDSDEHFEPKISKNDLCYQKLIRLKVLV